MVSEIYAVALWFFVVGAVTGALAIRVWWLVADRRVERQSDMDRRLTMAEWLQIAEATKISPAVSVPRYRIPPDPACID